MTDAVHFKIGPWLWAQKVKVYIKKFLCRNDTPNTILWYKVNHAYGSKKRNLCQKYRMKFT